MTQEVFDIHDPKLDVHCWKGQEPVLSATINRTCRKVLALAAAVIAAGTIVTYYASIPPVRLTATNLPGRDYAQISDPAHYMTANQVQIPVGSRIYSNDPGLIAAVQAAGEAHAVMSETFGDRLILFKPVGDEHPVYVDRNLPQMRMITAKVGSLANDLQLSAALQSVEHSVAPFVVQPGALADMANIPSSAPSLPDLSNFVAPDGSIVLAPIVVHAHHAKVDERTIAPQQHVQLRDIAPVEEASLAPKGAGPSF